MITLKGNVTCIPSVVSTPVTEPWLKVTVADLAMGFDKLKQILGDDPSFPGYCGAPNEQ